MTNEFCFSLSEPQSCILTAFPLISCIDVICLVPLLFLNSLLFASLLMSEFISCSPIVTFSVSVNDNTWYYSSHYVNAAPLIKV